MNWFTKTYVKTKSLQAKKELVTEHGGCEHVESDPSLLAVVSYENDSFGREGYCMCEACNDASVSEEDEEEVQCHDCKQTFKRKETIEWKWYDFHAPAGEEPLTICDACRKGEKHIARVRKDREDLEREMADWED